MPGPVTVSAPTAADGDEFIAAARASRDAVLPWVDPPDSRERFAAYVSRSGGQSLSASWSGTASAAASSASSTSTTSSAAPSSPATSATPASARIRAMG